MTSMEGETSPDPRLNEIRDVIQLLAAGQLQARGRPSARGDKLDAILADLNSLASSLAGRIDQTVMERDALEVSVRERVTELERVNAQLHRSLGALEKHNVEISLLSQMGDMLQSSLTPHEAYAIVAQFAGQLFPSDSGTLYVYSTSRDIIEDVAHWGQPAPHEPVFPPADCWALRRGRAYLVEGGKAVVLCRHVSKEECDGGASLCVPMSAHGEILGMVHVCIGGAREAPDWAQYLAGQQRLLTTVVEHTSLAIANLKLRETMRSLSIRDQLTGLFNRRYLEESLERELRRAERLRGNLGVLMRDLDHFKQFNDTYGHEAGDMLLRELGDLLRAHVRGADIACRYGGEEFALILSEASLEVTYRRAQELLAAVRELTVHYHTQMLGRITISIGAAAYPQHGSSGDGLVRAADIALYRAKREGRDRLMVAPTATDMPVPPVAAAGG